MEDDWSPAILPTSNTVWIWNLRFSLDMEKMVDSPLIFGNQKLAEKFKFEI